jgi:hypothetical protein
MEIYNLQAFNFKMNILSIMKAMCTKAALIQYHFGVSLEL